MRRLTFLFCFALAATLAQAEEWMVKRKLAGNFVDTRDAVVMAIENRGLVINYTSHIADMLQRTGADIGATRQIFEQAEIIEFCSAGLSRKMMEMDPHNIVFCPFAISIYTLPGEKNTTWVSYRQPQGPAARLVAPLLRDIAAEAGF
ncbi:MAG: DUF302 domain-containing protein [Azonexus sp.]|nr:DUF302 domain-containing protein [Azonexus sp.]